VHLNPKIALEPKYDLIIQPPVALDAILSEGSLECARLALIDPLSDPEVFTSRDGLAVHRNN
jgi:hypothetical protein